MNSHETDFQTGLEIAVIGMAGRFPKARNIARFWHNLKKGEECITFFTEQELLEAGVEPALLRDHHYVKARGVLEDVEYFDALFFDYSPREAGVMDPQLRVIHECTWHALEDAGYVPESYSGLIGIYVGAASNLLWIAQSMLQAHNSAALLSVKALNNPSSFSTRISYKLNLKGPSLVVQTACSSSLAAIHIACQGLLAGECDMALAGGVRIAVPQEAGYLFEEEMVSSPDGHCRAFDAQAKGTVPGNGVGMVVLKRLAEAVFAGDHIYAVVRDSAVNNDGKRKVGYTAPSIDGQAETIRTAYQRAEISPESVGFIETHGTGTSVGDPIEVEALKLAFHSDKERFCAIGSVKTNIGHLDTAAGVAGFIKTVLALKHRLIPPSLHFETPNPKVDFQNSPFYVNTELKKWNGDGSPLRAGVSAFGIGGTNVHLLLEEAPATDASQQGREWKLIVLSARTESALDKASQDFVVHLKENPGINLADAAYTLQTGRRAWGYRRMLVCSEVNEAVEALSSPDPGEFYTYFPEEKNRPVVFMFSGQGSQYINMGSELYHGEPFFRETMNRCFDMLKAMTGGNMKDILYPDSHSEEAEERIYRQDVSQLILFIFEYSLAQLLMKWGIKPQAMIGYSIGEYVAACLAGIFSLGDALSLVSLRGRLMQKMPTGVMLSVPLPEEALRPMLNDGLSIAVVNGPSCVVSGSPEAIDAFEQEMKKKKCLCMRLKIPLAGHSLTLDSVLREFEKEVANVTLNVPQIPLISSVTGEWLTNEEAVKPGYWASHLREPVRFVDGVKKLLAKKSSIFLEIGPGIDLSTLVRRHIEAQSEHSVLNMVRHAQKRIPDVYLLLKNIGRLWLYGLKIDWHGFYLDEVRHRIPLPVYPFDRQYYGKKGIGGGTFTFRPGILSRASLLEEKRNISEWFYIPNWRKTTSPHLLNSGVGASPPGQWLIFVDDGGIGTEIVKCLRQKDCQVVSVSGAESFSRLNDLEYTINVRRCRDYERLVEELASEGRLPEMIVHLWSVTTNEGDRAGLEAFNEFQAAGFYSLLFLVQALAKSGLTKLCSLQIIVVTSHVQAVSAGEKICPEKATILGLVKTIPLEYRNVMCRSIDLDITQKGPNKKINKISIDQLTAELLSGSTDLTTAYRGNSRWVQYFEPLRLDYNGGCPVQLKERGVYLITGGLGRDSLIRAEYLAGTVKAKLVLTGRTALPARENWQQWAATHPDDDPLTVKIKKVQDIERLGGETLVIKADVSNEAAMGAVIQQIDEKFGRLDGVIHAAGITNIESSALIPGIGFAESELHFKPKVYGLYVLQKVLKGRKLDFCVLTSSIASIIGGVGHSAYAAANIFMDAFAHKFNQIDSVSWTSLNWLGVSPQETKEAFHKMMFLRDIPQLTVFNTDLNVLIQEKVKERVLQAEAVGESVEPTALFGRSEWLGPYRAPRDKTEKDLVNIWQRLFGLEKVGIGDDFLELGGDSLQAITVISTIQKELHVSVPLADFFNKPTIEELAGFINEAKKSVCLSIEPVEKREYYALSSVQKRLYFLQQLDFVNTAYNVPFAVSLVGRVEEEKLAGAFRTIIARHESLRASFEIVGGEPVQQVHRTVDFEIEYYRLTAEGVRRTVDGIIGAFVRPFDLSRAPLLRVGLIRADKTGSVPHHILMIDMHHIITDGASQEILGHEFVSVLSGDGLLPLRLQYKDFSEWQNKEKKNEVIKRQKEYWLSQFEGEIPVLNLPTDYPRPPIQSFSGSQLRFDLSIEETEALRELAVREGATVFMVLFSILNVWLSKLSGQEEIMVGTPIAGRRHTDLQGVIGMFVNTLVIKSYPRGVEPFRGFLKQVKERALAAFENQDFQFEDLVDEIQVNRDFSRNPLFDVMFVLQNLESPEAASAGLRLLPYRYEGRISKFDLCLYGSLSKGKLRFILEYGTSLFKKETIERFVEYFKNIMRAAVEKPKQKIREIEVMPEAERQRILYEFNNTKVEYPQEMTIHQLFEEQSEKTPDSMAIFSQEVQLTYRELGQGADRLAGRLRGKGAAADTLICLMVERSAAMVVGILGILKSGAAYLPIDPAYPGERVQYMLDDSSSKILVNESVKSAEVSEKLEVIGLNKIIRENKDFSTQPIQSPQSGPSNLAYVLYTSGSTGEPKGVMVEHRSVTNLLVGLQQLYPFEVNDTYLLKTSYMFDVSVTEMFGWFLGGGRLAILEKAGEKNPGKIVQAIIEHRVTHMNFVPSMFNGFLEALSGRDIHCLSTLKYIFLAGEALLPGLVDKFNRLDSGACLENLYGPTEATVYASGYSLSQWADRGSVPIGRPLQNTRLYILDRDGNVQPIGIWGELYIGGDGVARGYLKRGELSSERFIPGPFAAGERLYRTGDLARWCPDGLVEYRGRIDQQVKIRGYRVELGEIESRLLKHEKVNEAVVTVKTDERGDQYLCAYVVPVNGGASGKGEDLDMSELREYLGKMLPDYMIPYHFKQLERIPLTASGKLDRNALPQAEAAVSTEYVAPASRLEKTIADIWREVLGVDQVGIHDNFFELGGNSLNILQVNSRLKEALGREVSVVMLFTYPTIRAFAGYIGQDGASEVLTVAEDDWVDTMIKSKTKMVNRRRDRIEQG